MSSPPIIRLNAADHSIKSVTIFKSFKAEIVRQFSLNLKAGHTKVKIRGLSGSIDVHSVRVSGLGEARLHDVVCTLDVSKDMSYAPDSPSEIIRLLQVKKHALENEKRVREHEADLLVNYAKTLSGEHVPPTQMSIFLESFVDQGRKNLNDITELNEKIIALDRQIEQETEKSVSKKGNSRGEVTIILGTDNSSVVDLKLTYIVGNASWKPTYELHAETENGKPSSAVALHYRARVVQSTGEDWTRTLLTLSTMSSDTVVKRIPQLMPVKLRPRARNLFFGDEKGFNTSNVRQQQQQQLQSVSRSVFGQAMSLSQQNQASQSRPQAFQSQPPTQSSLSTSAFGALAASTHATSLPSQTDDTFEEVSAPEAITEPTHQLQSPFPSLASQPYHLMALSTRIEPRVYLQCEVKNSSDYRLLAGPVSVILDDSYVSKTAINDVGTGENFGCTLGDDAATKVTYSRTARTMKSEGGSFSETLNTTTCTTVITIDNKHGFALSDVVVRDAVPTVDDRHAKVILRKPEGLADSKNGEEVAVRKGGQQVGTVAWEKQVDGKGGEKEGKFAWKVKVNAKDKVILESQWELKAPADGTCWQESMAD